MIYDKFMTGRSRILSYIHHIDIGLEYLQIYLNKKDPASPAVQCNIIYVVDLRGAFQHGFRAAIIHMMMRCDLAWSSFFALSVV